MNKTTLIAVLFVAIFAAVVSPLLLIWALNTLFGLGIAFGFFEWLAALLILGMLRNGKLAELQLKK
jgi:hypothetical protein